MAQGSKKKGGAKKQLNKHKIKNAKSHVVVMKKKFGTAKDKMNHTISAKIGKNIEEIMAAKFLKEGGTLRIVAKPKDHLELLSGQKGTRHGPRHKADLAKTNINKKTRAHREADQLKKDIDKMKEKDEAAAAAKDEVE